MTQTAPSIAPASIGSTTSLETVSPASHATNPRPRRVKLAYIVSHPIQYQAPLLRRIAQEPDIDLTVFFGSDFSLRNYVDKGFGIAVQWDVPLVEGYQHEFLPLIRDDATSSPTAPINHGIFTRLRGRSGEAPGVPFDAVWVHGYSSVNAIQAIVVAYTLGIPVLLRAESSLIDRSRSPLKLLAKRLFFKALRPMISAVLPIGTLNASYWHHYLGADFPAFPFPYAVDNDYFRRRSVDASAGRSALQAELGLDPSRQVILFASKLQERKRCIDLLEAYLRLAPALGAEPHPYLVIVGDGEERIALEERSRQSGIKSIRFCGFRNQSELPRFFDLATVFVLPSRHEPWGLIVNEVMNAAKPVILSGDVGCQPDLVEDGVEGFVFPAGDVAALADALQKIVETPGLAGSMGEQALARIQRWEFERDVRGLRAALAYATKRLPESERLM